MTTRTVLLASLTLIIMLVACGAPNTPASPSLPPIETPAQSFGPDEIPAGIQVRNPKDARRISGCLMLTGAQLHELGLLADTARDNQVGLTASCTWALAGDPDDKALIAVITDTEEPALLGQYRLQVFKPRFAFEPTEVAGHPAVAQRTIPGAPCSLETGIADDQLMSTTDSSTANQNSCGLARRMAEAVLSNLPPKR